MTPLQPVGKTPRSTTPCEKTNILTNLFLKTWKFVSSVYTTLEGRAVQLKKDFLHKITKIWDLLFPVQKIDENFLKKKMEKILSELNNKPQEIEIDQESFRPERNLKNLKELEKQIKRDLMVENFTHTNSSNPKPIKRHKKLLDSELKQMPPENAEEKKNQAKEEITKFVTPLINKNLQPKWPKNKDYTQLKNKELIQLLPLIMLQQGSETDVFTFLHQQINKEVQITLPDGKSISFFDHQQNTGQITAEFFRIENNNADEINIETTTDNKIQKISKTRFYQFSYIDGKEPSVTFKVTTEFSISKNPFKILFGSPYTYKITLSKISQDK